MAGNQPASASFTSQLFQRHVAKNKNKKIEQEGGGAVCVIVPNPRHVYSEVNPSQVPKCLTIKPAIFQIEQGEQERQVWGGEHNRIKQC